MELLREPNDRSSLLLILLVRGAGDKVNEANVGDCKASKSCGLDPVLVNTGGDWD